MQTASYNPSFLFVEGDSDELFLNRVYFANVGSVYSIFPYAQKRSNAKKLLNAIQLQNGKFIFLHDSDSSVNLDLLKINLANEYGITNCDSICIVIWEIESWLIAGMSNDERLKLKSGSLPMSKWRSPQRINKEYFEEIADKNNLNKTAFEEHCRQIFDFQLALGRSKSMKDFHEKFTEIFMC